MSLTVFRTVVNEDGVLILGFPRLGIKQKFGRIGDDDFSERVLNSRCYNRLWYSKVLQDSCRHVGELGAAGVESKGICKVNWGEGKIWKAIFNEIKRIHAAACH